MTPSTLLSALCKNPLASDVGTDVRDECFCSLSTAQQRFRIIRPNKLRKLTMSAHEEGV